jgi:UDP-N-acetylglucosamine acyltransferase
MANSVGLAGHITIGDWAILGGIVAVHQFVRIGAYAIIGGQSAVSQDIPPYVSAAGNRAKLYGLNLVGLKRRGFSDEAIANLKKTYRIIFRSGLILEEALSKVKAELADSPEAMHLMEFMKNSKRGITR